MKSGLRMSQVCSLLAFTSVLGVCKGNVVVYPVNTSTLSFEDRPATFGSVITGNGISGDLVIANPLNACLPLQLAPRSFSSIGRQYFALIKQSNCHFGRQVLNAQNADFSAAIIYNKNSDELFMMDGSIEGRQVYIPSVFVGKSAGDQLKQFTYKTGANVVITAFTGPTLLIYLVPFVIVVGLCFLFMAVFTIIRYYRHRMRVRRTRLTRANLKKILCKKFRKGDEYDVCAICLDDYEEGDKLRVLPCEHVYHCKCVDPWLLEGKRTCPVCKQPVEIENTPRRSRRSYAAVSSGSYEEQEHEEESEHEEGNGNRDPVTERTPLIHGRRSPTSTPANPVV